MDINTKKGLALPKVGYKPILGKRKGLGADVISSAKKIKRAIILNAVLVSPKKVENYNDDKIKINYIHPDKIQRNKL